MKQTMAEEQKTKISEKEVSQNEDPLLRDIQISTSYKAPCEVGDEAFIPYWTKEDTEVIYGIDKYTVKGLCGCGDVWICHVINKNNSEIWNLEPNVDVFFSEKDAERKLNGIKKTEDTKKLAKWKRRVS